MEINCYTIERLGLEAAAVTKLLPYLSEDVGFFLPFIFGHLDSLSRFHSSWKFGNDSENLLMVAQERLQRKNNNGATRQSDGPKVTNLILNVTVSPLQTSGMMLSPLTSRDSKEIGKGKCSSSCPNVFSR